MRRSERRGMNETERTSFIPRVIVDEYKDSADVQRAGDNQMTIDQAREYLANFELLISNQNDTSND